MYFSFQILLIFTRLLRSIEGKTVLHIPTITIYFKMACLGVILEATSILGGDPIKHMEEGEEVTGEGKRLTEAGAQSCRDLRESAEHARKLFTDTNPRGEELGHFSSDFQVEGLKAALGGISCPAAWPFRHEDEPTPLSEKTLR